MAAYQGDNPLKPEDLSTLNSVIERAHKHADLLNKAKACGLPVDEHIDRNQAHIDLASNIKKQFFPTEI